MKYDDLIRRVASNGGISFANAREHCDELLRGIAWALIDPDSEITLRGIGKLSVVATAARRGRNPKTGEEIDIPVGAKVKFSAAGSLRRAVAEAHAPKPQRMTGGERNAPALAKPGKEMADRGTVRLGSGCIAAEMPKR